MRLVTIAISSLLLANCMTSGVSNIVTSKDSVSPGSSVSRSGTAVKLLGSASLQVGAAFPDVSLSDAGFQKRQLSGKGGVRLLSIVPSVDTVVCEEQTHLLGESSAIHPAVERITISRDLPMAQRRFAKEAKLTNVTYLSDYQ